MSNVNDFFVNKSVYSLPGIPHCTVDCIREILLFCFGLDLYVSTAMELDGGLAAGTDKTYGQAVFDNC